MNERLDRAYREQILHRQLREERRYRSSHAFRLQNHMLLVIGLHLRECMVSEVEYISLTSRNR